MENLFKYKNVEFQEGTPLELCDIILSLANSKKLVTIKTGHEDWHEKITEEGYIVLSKGKHHVGVFIKPDLKKSAGRLYSSFIYQLYADGVLLYDCTVKTINNIMQ